MQVLPKSARGPEQLAARFPALIAQLYTVESRTREHRLTAQELLAQRLQHSAPVFGQIEALLLTNVYAVLPGSLLGKALHYLSSQWTKLALYVTDGARRAVN